MLINVHIANINEICNFAGCTILGHPVEASKDNFFPFWPPIEKIKTLVKHNFRGQLNNKLVMNGCLNIQR
jgi:hypothetical protein